MQTVSVDEIATLLGRFKPDSLAVLRAQAPSELQPELVVGGIAGEGDQLLRERAKFAVAAIDDFVPTANFALCAAQRSLAKARMIRLSSEILTIACCAGTLAGLGFSKEVVANLMSILSLFAAIGTVIAEHFVRLSISGNTSLLDLYTQLTNQMYELRLTGERLRAFINRVERLEEVPELERLIEKANEICRFINLMKHSLLQERL